MLWLLRCEPEGLSDESIRSLGELFCSADEVRASSISELVFRNPFLDPFDDVLRSHWSTTGKERCIETVTITPDVEIAETDEEKASKSWKKVGKSYEFSFFDDSLAVLRARLCFREQETERTYTFCQALRGKLRSIEPNIALNS